MTLVVQPAAGDETIPSYRTHEPGVLVMDSKLSPVSGISATAQIVEEFPDPRILILKTYDGDNDIRRARQAGVRSYFWKCPRREELLSVGDKTQAASTAVRRGIVHLD